RAYLVKADRARVEDRRDLVAERHEVLEVALADRAGADHDEAHGSRHPLDVRPRGAPHSSLTAHHERSMISSSGRSLKFVRTSSPCSPRRRKYCSMRSSSAGPFSP